MGAGCVRPPRRPHHVPGPLGQLRRRHAVGGRHHRRPAGARTHRAGAGPRRHARQRARAPRLLRGHHRAAHGQEGRGADVRRPVGHGRQPLRRPAGHPRRPVHPDVHAPPPPGQGAVRGGRHRPRPRGAAVQPAPDVRHARRRPGVGGPAARGLPRRGPRPLAPAARGQPRHRLRGRGDERGGPRPPADRPQRRRHHHRRPRGRAGAPGRARRPLRAESPRADAVRARTGRPRRAVHPGPAARGRWRRAGPPLRRRDDRRVRLLLRHALRHGHGCLPGRPGDQDRGRQRRPPSHVVRARRGQQQDDGGQGEPVGRPPDRGGASRRPEGRRPGRRVRHRVPLRRGRQARPRLRRAEGPQPPPALRPRRRLRQRRPLRRAVRSTPRPHRRSLAASAARSATGPTRPATST